MYPFKTKHKYNAELENALIKMDNDQFFDWLQTNEIEYEKSFQQVILEDRLDEENKK